MTAFGKKRRELAAPALSSSSSTPPPLSFPRARLSLSLFLRYSLAPALFLSLGERTPGLAPSRGCSRERKTKAGGRRGRIEWRSLVRLSRSVYLSGKEARKRRSSCSVFLSLSLFLSFSLFLPIFSSRHRPVIPPSSPFLPPSLPSTLRSCSYLCTE